MVVKFGKQTIPVVTIPKGTLLFRGVMDPETDYNGVNGCISPHYNVFFYFSPFVLDGISGWYDNIEQMQVYVASQDLRVAFLLSPSKFTRKTRLTKKQFMVPCNKTRKSCITGRAYDPCFRDSFMEKHPSLVGWTAIGHADIRDFKKTAESGRLGRRLHFVPFAKDARGLEGPPELALYPLKRRHMKDVEPPSDRDEFNYKHIASLSRKGESLEQFMEKHSERAKGKWYYMYKE